MWRSIGDKFDLEPHDDKKHPRRIKTNIAAVVLIIVCFLASSYSVGIKLIEWGISAEALRTLQTTVFATTACITAALAVVKYMMNKREMDMALVIATLVFAMIAFFVL